MNFNLAWILKDFLFPRNMETFLSTFYLTLLLLLLLSYHAILHIHPGISSYGSASSKPLKAVSILNSWA